MPSNPHVVAAVLRAVRAGSRRDAAAERSVATVVVAARDSVPRRGDPPAAHVEAQRESRPADGGTTAERIDWRLGLGGDSDAAGGTDGDAGAAANETAGAGPARREGGGAGAGSDAAAAATAAVADAAAAAAGGATTTVANADVGTEGRGRGGPVELPPPWPEPAGSNAELMVPNASPRAARRRPAVPVEPAPLDEDEVRMSGKMKKLHSVEIMPTTAIMTPLNANGCVCRKPCGPHPIFSPNREHGLAS